MHLGMPGCHKPFFGHCDLWPSFQELLCPEHIFYIIWCRNPNFRVVIPLGMAEWCIPFWVTLTLTSTSGLISRFLELYYSYLSSNVSYARSIPLGAFVTCLWHFLLFNVTPIVGVCNCSMFCCTLLYVHSSIAIILMGKRELIALLNLSSWCLVMVERLFLAVQRGCLQFLIEVFPDHTHLLFLKVCSYVEKYAKFKN